MNFKKLFLSLFFVLASLCAYAEVQITANVNKTLVDTSEDITLTITVKAPTTRDLSPIMPSLPNFNIYASGQDISRGMINGKVSSVQVFTYLLTPRFAGKSTIGSFTVNVDGQTYTTEPIEVEVYRAGQGNAKTSLNKTKKPAKNAAYTAANNSQIVQTLTNIAAAAAKNAASQSEAKAADAKNKISQVAPDFFMTAKTDKTTAYLNEQITLKIRFYQAFSTLGNPLYDRPKMEGLISEEIKTSTGYETIGSRQFAFTEFDIAVFGIVPGQAKIGSAAISYNVADSAMDAFDLFFSGRTGITKKVETAPIDISIRPLPKDGKPTSFYGAVGADYKINAEVDNSATQAGAPITLTVSISGNGNMRAIGNLPPPDLGGSFRVYETTSSSSTKIQNTLVGGTKVYKTIIVPRATGKYNIAPIEFSYFDTNEKIYKTIKLNDISLEVSPAAQETSEASAVSFAGDNPAQARVEKLSDDISYIKNGQLSLPSKILLFIANLGKINYLVFFFIAAALLFYFIDKGSIDLLSSRRALLKAKKAIIKAKELDGVSDALEDYLEAKLGEPIGSKTMENVSQKLALSAGLSAKLNGLWEEFSMLKYAPSSMVNAETLEDSAKKTLNLIEEIEKEIR
ncbi:MAG: BatD family protein [Elusimicrobiota bacterium]|jgi:hypothetical protein|nr:BatD family protein [Elusimicrobiota bacterium]